MGEDRKTQDRVGALISTIARMSRTRFDIRARELGLTRPQWRALNSIRFHPGINQSSLAAMLEVEQMTVTRQLDLLEARGWIERRADPGDRRTRRLYLTENTAPLLESLNGVAEQLHDDLYCVVSPAEQKQLEKTLGKLHRRLSELLNEADEPEAIENAAAAFKVVSGKK